PHAIARPQEAVAELAVLTSAPRSAIDARIAMKGRAKLIVDRWCGDAAACTAVRAFASDAARFVGRVGKAPTWGIPKSDTFPSVARTLSNAERDSIGGLAWAIVVTAHGEALPSQLPTRAAFAATAALAADLHALVYDEVVHRIESADGFGAHVIT